MIVKLLTERHLEFLSITGGCRGPSESTLVKMSICWKSPALAHLSLYIRTRGLLKRITIFFALFLQTVYAIEKLLADFKVQPRIGINQSLILIVLQLSRDAANDVTWVHTASSTFLHSQLQLFDYFSV